jgi:hypothetical protein
MKYYGTGTAIVCCYHGVYYVLEYLISLGRPNKGLQATLNGVILSRPLSMQARLISSMVKHILYTVYPGYVKLTTCLEHKYYGIYSSNITYHILPP